MAKENPILESLNKRGAACMAACAGISDPINTITRAKLALLNAQNRLVRVGYPLCDEVSEIEDVLALLDGKEAK